MFEVAKVIDGVATTGWAVDGNTKHEARTAWFVAEKPFGFPGGTDLHVRLDFQSAYGGHSIGRARLAVTADAAAATISKVPQAIAQVLAVPAEKRDAKQRETLQKHYRETVSPILKEPAAQLEKLRAELKTVQKQVPNVMVMQQMDRPRETHILLRGQYDQRGEKVGPGTPASLPPLPAGAPPNRLGLARWLIDPQHPLIARVTVNRFWKNFMGTGIVKTVDDFGAQGEWPSHPELLDWLAVEFTASGWDVKRLSQLIVTTATYRQSARVTPELKERDPDNRLYARGPRFRLSAEEIRDTALAVSGLLNPKIGGPSVSPYQPAGLWEELSSRKDSGNWTAQFFDAEPRRGSLSAQHVHLLETHLSAAADADLRRARPRDLHRQPRAHEHAAPGARAAERPDLRRSLAHPRRADDDRGRRDDRRAHPLRLPARHRARPRRARDRGADRAFSKAKNPLRRAAATKRSGSSATARRNATPRSTPPNSPPGPTSPAPS